ISATPPLMDSTMYLCSGLERCSKWMPVEAVMSTSCGKEPAVGELAVRAADCAEVAAGFRGLGLSGDCEYNDHTARTHTAPAPQIVWVTRIGKTTNQL